MANYAFIDGQNLNLGTKTENPPWYIDFKKFRIYLKEKYGIDKAYYFLGYVKDDCERLYLKLQEAGFIVQFKQTSAMMASTKKGNVDCDIIFHVMQRIADNPEEMAKVTLVSCDGDYKQLVDYLIKKDKFMKILFPNKKFASSLYKSLGSERYDYLVNIKSYIEFIPNTHVS